MPKALLSKSKLIESIADGFQGRVTRKAVKEVVESVAGIGHRELKRRGIFVVPGLVRLVVAKRAATQERTGINPFTGQETVFKAKPARKVIKGRPVKAVKDAIA